MLGIRTESLNESGSSHAEQVECAPVGPRQHLAKLTSDESRLLKASEMQSARARDPFFLAKLNAMAQTATNESWRSPRRLQCAVRHRKYHKRAAGASTGA
jgi:hypothetical protein